MIVEWLAEEVRPTMHACPRITNLNLQHVGRADMLGWFSASQDTIPKEATTMSVQENIELMRRWFKEVWNEGRTQTVYDLLAPDAVAIGQLEDHIPLRGPVEFAAFVERTRGAFPDIKVMVEDVFGAEDKVVLRWSAMMTHSGDHLGMPATGERVRLSGITIARFADKRIIEGWDHWDQLGMLKQIGVYRSPEASLLKKSA
jgi:steroid delta-isomerase-like uncharacterized protein